MHIECLKKVVTVVKNDKIAVKNVANERTASSRSRSTVCRSKQKLVEFLADLREQQRLDPSFLLLTWAQRLGREDEEMFDNSGVQFVDPADIPKDTRVKN